MNEHASLFFKHCNMTGKNSLVKIFLSSLAEVCTHWILSSFTWFIDSQQNITQTYTNVQNKQ